MHEAKKSGVVIFADNQLLSPSFSSTFVPFCRENLSMEI
jgi:hypothetical protein